eukprot:5510258-Amphidinium_carterae.1
MQARLSFFTARVHASRGLGETDASVLGSCPSNTPWAWIHLEGVGTRTACGSNIIEFVTLLAEPTKFAAGINKLHEPRRSVLDHILYEKSDGTDSKFEVVGYVDLASERAVKDLLPGLMKVVAAIEGKRGRVALRHDFAPEGKPGAGLGTLGTLAGYGVELHLRSTDEVATRGG